MPFKIPGNTDRTAIVGRNGTGKTQLAVFLLSEMNWTEKPFIVFNTKRDELIGGIPGAKETTLHSELPDEPGIYILHHGIGQEEQLNHYLGRIWEHENLGVFIDEGYAFSNSPELRATLTQGRSKKISMIILAQRPSNVSRFIFSEANYIDIFPLNDVRDRKTVSGYLPSHFDIEAKTLPPHWSYWYDAKSDKVETLRPVPSADKIYARFRERLPHDLPQERHTNTKRHRAL